MKKEVLILMKRKFYNVVMIFKKIMKNEKTRVVNRTVLQKNHDMTKSIQMSPQIYLQLVTTTYLADDF